MLLFILLNNTIGLAQENPDFPIGPPNIVIFLSDDHSAEDVGYLGNRDVTTPVIDKLASEGMIFTKAFAASSVCSPSRSSIFTGLFPHRHGCDVISGQIFDNKEIKTLPEYLSEVGYRVGLAGKTHVYPKEAFPFEYLERHEIQQFLNANKEDPFCLIVAYNNPHEPYFNKKNGTRSRSIHAKEWMPNTPETKALIAGYYDNVENLDNEIGTSLYWLKEMDALENTIQIYTSDHGSGLPFAKWTLYEQGLRVPLVIKWKDVIKPGTRSDAMISLVDLLPTLLAATGSSKTIKNIDGENFLPVILGEKDNHRTFICATYTNRELNDGNKYPIRSIRNERFKLILNFNYKEPFSIRMTTRPDTRAIIGGYRAAESWKRISRDNDFAAKRYHEFKNRPKFELYDLENDPYELDNLIDHTQYERIAQELKDELKKWMSQQNDPMLKNM